MDSLLVLSGQSHTLYSHKATTPIVIVLHWWGSYYTQQWQSVRVKYNDFLSHICKNWNKSQVTHRSCNCSSGRCSNSFLLSYIYSDLQTHKHMHAHIHKHKHTNTKDITCALVNFRVLGRWIVFYLWTKQHQVFP